MEQQERIRLLLSMQEHPERFTDEQITRMLAEDPELAELMEQFCMAKRAFVRQEVDKEHIPMDELWEQFASMHKEELDTLESQSERQSANPPVVGSPSGKIFSWVRHHGRVAAVFSGIILAAGFAFAAIHIVRHHQDLKSANPESEMVNPLPHQTIAPDTIIPMENPRTDTATMAVQAVSMEPVAFDNVPLGEMLPEIAAYYQAEVSFRNEAARYLRFHFVWKREDGLEHAIEKLNRFESLNIRLEKSTIIVE
ncbi:MAG: DUF4974 domain-containing protein [Prevotella sp.]|nr:DUF4974 domain-containing protein [Prevotella sp.]